MWSSIVLQFCRIYGLTAKIEAIEMEIERGSHMRRLPVFVCIDLVVAPHK